jgi:hypothetical protein
VPAPVESKRYLRVRKRVIEQPERFEGTYMPLLGPFSMWPPGELTLLIAWETDAGVTETWATPASTLLVVVKPVGAPPVRVESGQIHGAERSAFLLCVRWTYPDIDIRVNEHWVGSTDPARYTVSSVELPAAAVSSVTLDLADENQKCQVARRKEMVNLRLRQGRLTASPTKPLRDLADARRQLIDLAAAMRRGDLYHDTALAARLRAMVCRSKDNIPLLQRVAGSLDVPLIAYSAIPSDDFVPPTQTAPIMAGDLCMHIRPEPNPPYATAMDLDYWLALRTLELKGSRYSNSQVILAFANTEGAHYDLGTDPLVAALRQVRGVSLHGPRMEWLHRFLLDVAVAAISLSKSVLDRSAGR